MLVPIKTVKITIPMFRSKRTSTSTQYGVRETIEQVPDGHRSGDVQLLIDVELLYRTLGDRALRNRGGKARGVGGAIELRALNSVDQGRAPKADE